MAVPSPVQFSVTDEDVSRMWRAVQIQRRGISSPSTLALAIVGIVEFAVTAVLSASTHRFPNIWMLLVCGWLITIVFKPTTVTTGTLRPSDLAFAADGLTIQIPFTSPYERHYPWSAIRRIDDLGDALVVVPKWKKRFIVPKRAFADGGIEAQAFLTAHGVESRALPPMPVKSTVLGV